MSKNRVTVKVGKSNLPLQFGPDDIDQTGWLKSKAIAIADVASVGFDSEVSTGLSLLGTQPQVQITINLKNGDAMFFEAKDTTAQSGRGLRGSSFSRQMF